MFFNQCKIYVNLHIYILCSDVYISCVDLKEIKMLSVFLFHKCYATHSSWRHYSAVLQLNEFLQTTCLKKTNLTLSHLQTLFSHNEQCLLTTTISPIFKTFTLKCSQLSFQSYHIMNSIIKKNMLFDIIPQCDYISPLKQQILQMQLLSSTSILYLTNPIITRYCISDFQLKRRKYWISPKETYTESAWFKCIISVQTLGIV